jgi:LysR family transcriptional regulator, nod-box dependent transcriptional activator
MLLSQFNFNLLVALDALLRERNVTRAGSRIGLSQPAMSGTLARQLELTPLGEELILPVREAVQQLENIIEHRHRFDPAVERRSFTIAASDYAGFLLLRPMLERLAVEAPGISLKFVKLDSGSRGLLASGVLDFIVMPSEVTPDLAGQLLFADRWVCAAWAGHPEIAETLTLERYLTFPHIVFGDADPAVSSVADYHFEQTGIVRNVIASIDSFLLAPFAIRGTRFLTLMHERLAERLKDAAELKLLPPPFELPDIHESIYWSPRHSSSPAHLWLRGIVAEVAAAL